jgi:hypothetical protein
MGRRMQALVFHRFRFHDGKRHNFAGGRKFWLRPTSTGRVIGSGLLEESDVLLPRIDLVGRTAHEFRQFLMFPPDLPTDEPNLETMPVFHGDRGSHRIICPHFGKIKNIGRLPT